MLAGTIVTFGPVTNAWLSTITELAPYVFVLWLALYLVRNRFSG